MPKQFENSKHYITKNGKLIQTNPFCPRCGGGVFMADRGEWWSCGKCGDTYYKKTFNFKGRNQASKELEDAE
jgi:small subunit ribosomal protein S27Ae